MNNFTYARDIAKCEKKLKTKAAPVEVATEMRGEAGRGTDEKEEEGRFGCLVLCRTRVTNTCNQIHNLKLFSMLTNPFKSVSLVSSFTSMDFRRKMHASEWENVCWIISFS